jgi:hypothetical protein
MLEGNLDDFTLPDILKLLAFTTKSGRLVLRRDDVVGRVDLHGGRVGEAAADAGRLAVGRRLLGAGLVSADDLQRVVAGREELPTGLELARGLTEAEVLGSGAVAEVLREQTVDALFDLVRWPEGTFRFEGREGDGDGMVKDLTLAVDELLASVEERLQSWPAVAERTGDSDAVVAISRPEGDRAEVALPADAWSLLSLVDGRRTIADLARLTGQGEYRTRRTLVTLLDAGIVTVGDGDGRGPVDRLLSAVRVVDDLEARLGGGPAPAGGTAPSAEVAPRAAPLPAPPSKVGAPTAAPPVPAAAPANGTSNPFDAPDRSRPGPVQVRDEDAPAAPAPRASRLRTDPSVDEALVRRLIDGVEQL